MQGILNALSTPIFVKDREHRCVFVNDAYCQFSGYPREALLGKTAHDFFPKSEADIFHDKDELVFTSGAENVNQEECTDRSGTKHMIITKKTLHTESDGKIYLVGVINDITEKIAAETELSKMQAFQESIIENIPNMIFVKDAVNLRFVRINRAGEELLGLSRDQLTGKSDYDFFPKKQADHFTAKDRQVLSGRECFDIPEETVHSYTKGERILHTRKVPVFDKQGQCHYLLGISEDITDRKQAERALEKSERLMIALINNTTSVVYMKDLDGRYLLVNHRYTELFKKTRDQVIGKTDFEIFPEAIAREFIKNDLTVLRSGVSSEFEEQAPHEDGLHTYISNKFPILDSRGNITGICGISTDVTIWKRAEIALREQEAIESKSQFLSMVSHELRTPLQSIREGIAVVLEGLLGTVNPDQAESLSIAKRNVDRLTRLINEVLDIQQLDAQQAHYEAQSYDFNEIALEVFKSMSPVAKSKGLTLKTELSKGLPHILFAKDRMTQVLLNLVTNAVKFTQHGEVLIRTCHKDENLVVSVHDTGVGIAAKDVPQLFKPFGQTRHMISHAGSTGLGLVISKKIVEQYGGRITVESDSNGSCFSFWFPIQR